MSSSQPSLRFQVKLSGRFRERPPPTRRIVTALFGWWQVTATIFVPFLGSRYLQLPPSLAKIRHEQLCTEASRPVASALRARGYATFDQLLPTSKLDFLLGEAGAAAGEILAAAALARELKSKQDVSGGGYDTFTPLSAFSRQGLVAGSRRTLTSKEGSRASSRGAVSRCGGRPGAGDETTKKKKGPPRISLDGLGFEGGHGGGSGKGGAWDPGRYTSRPEEWIRPPPSVIKQRWDDNKKVRAGVVDIKI